MAELPKFITEVPEQSLTPKQVNDSITRIQKNIFIEDTTVAATIYTVPEGYVFEIVYVAQGVASGSATLKLTSLTIHSPGLSSPSMALQSILTDHVEHVNKCVSFNPLTIIANENDTIRTSGASTTNRSIIVHGFLIKKTELSEKTNINL